jgi:hypothetical protein
MLVRTNADLNAFHRGFYAAAIAAAAAGEPYRAPLPLRTNDSASSTAAQPDTSCPEVFIGSYRHFGDRIVRIPTKEKETHG